LARRKVGAEEADFHFLRAGAWPVGPRRGKVVRIADLFAGCGGLTLGVVEACRALGLDCSSALAIDTDPVALAVYDTNFPGGHRLASNVDEVFDGDIGARQTAAEREIARRSGPIELLIGGPPCEGHSDFNNRTRHSDVRNALYLRMVRAAELLEPEHVIIENVPGARRDRGDVVARSLDALSRLGYKASIAVIDTCKIGVAQRRRRLILVASRMRDVDLSATEKRFSVDSRSVEWAISDLAAVRPDSPFDQAVDSAPATRRRIDYLFRHDLYDLPNAERPACHADRDHTYRSVYGRLRSDQPSQTITTGFYSMCMGRYVHPVLPRTLTAHEAARLQFFPDFFDFSAARRRTDLARLIGNAAPMKLSYVVALELLR
jgi:DNA (cytosine-5)-methyltransferase 1